MTPAMPPADTPADFAATHRAAFDGAGWSIDDFKRYDDDPKTLIAGEPSCFAVIRVIGPEAEILTLATHPDHQGRGRATKMLSRALQHLKTQGVDVVFLDVAEANAAALSLYRRTGFTTFSTRANYYANGASAICMKADLSATPAA